MKKTVAKHALLGYGILTFACTWTFWFASGVLEFQGTLPPLDRGWFTAQIGVFCPSLLALAFTAHLHPEKRRSCLAIALGIYLPAAVLGSVVAEEGASSPTELPFMSRLSLPVFALIVLTVVLFSRSLVLATRGPLGARTLRWVAAAALQLPLFFLAGWTLISLRTGDFGVGVLEGAGGHPAATLVALFSFDTIFGGALGEELGWRGFLLPRLLERRRPLDAALVLGVIWSLWHLPIDLAAGFGAPGLGGVAFRLLFTVSLSVIVTWYFIRSGHGLLAALLIHATLNWLPILEFANYDSAMAILFILMLIFALAVGFGDADMRRPPRSRWIEQRPGGVMSTTKQENRHAP